MRKHLTKEHKMKLRLANLGKKHRPGRWTLKARKRHSSLLRGKKLRPWTKKEKLAQSIRIANTWTPEKRKRQSRIKKGIKLGPWTKERKQQHVIICTGRKMSLESRMKKMGPNHPFWKGGVEAIGKAIRHLPESKKWTQEVFKKDGFHCLKCGKGGNLKSHHKKAFALILKEFLQFYSQFSPLEDLTILIRLAWSFAAFWDINNGGTLCEDCHDGFHLIYGNAGDNTPEQWNEFIGIKEGVAQ